jgi:hypothetical protein
MQLGANLTYARRYSLLAILGVHPSDEDDDGNTAGPAGPAPRSATVPPPPRPAPKPTVRQMAMPFITQAEQMLKLAEGSEDAVWATFDAIKEKEGWAKLNEAEQAIIHRARLAAMPPEPEQE